MPYKSLVSSLAGKRARIKAEKLITKRKKEEGEGIVEISHVSHPWCSLYNVILPLLAIR